MFSPGNFVPLSRKKSKHKAKKCDKNEQNGVVILVPKCQKPFTVRQVILAGKCNDFRMRFSPIACDFRLILTRIDIMFII